MNIKFWKRRNHHVEGKKKRMKSDEEKIEKLRREYEMKAKSLQIFMNMPTLTYMSRACKELEKLSN